MLQSSKEDRMNSHQPPAAPAQAAQKPPMQRVDVYILGRGLVDRGGDVVRIQG